MPPAFWIHCNICSALLGKDVSHFLLSCKHILCKACMKYTHSGKKCPLDKSDIRYEQLSKLSEKTKNHFQPRVQNLFMDPAKILTFQQTQTRNMAKLTRDFKQKNRQAFAIYEKEKQDIAKLKSQMDKMTKQRRQMQEKLKEVYVKNKMKRQSQIYRNPHNSTVSSGFSSDKNPTPSFNKSPKQTKSDFFNENSLGDNSSASSDFFRPKAPPTRGKQHLKTAIEHTQSNRTPFFT